MPSQGDNGDGLSEYEKMRLENIRRNNAFFQELNLSQVLFKFTCKC